MPWVHGIFLETMVCCTAENSPQKCIYKSFMSVCIFSRSLMIRNMRKQTKLASHPSKNLDRNE